MFFFIPIPRVRRTVTRNCARTYPPPQRLSPPLRTVEKIVLASVWIPLAATLILLVTAPNLAVWGAAAFMPGLVAAGILENRADKSKHQQRTPQAPPPFKPVNLRMWHSDRR
jgi:hypothetical protein